MNSDQLRVLCLGLLLLCLAPRAALAGIFDPDADATVPPEHLRADLHTIPNQDNFGKLEGGGKLLDQSLDPRWLYSLVYFPRGGKRGLPIQNNLTAINVFLAAEVRRPQTVRAFLEKHLQVFLADTLATDGMFPISSGAVEDGYASSPDSMPNSSGKSKRLQQKLRPYARPDETVITGNVWTVDINVLTNHGAVEHWLVKGRVTPMQIDSFLCEGKEPERTFEQPLIWYR